MTWKSPGKKLEQWALQWGMNFNPTKCYILSLKRTAEKRIHMYTLCNVILKSVSTTPYLGVLLSEDMTYTDHIRKICSKACKTLGFLSQNLKYCPPNLRETVYISMCRSILEYAASIWYPYLVPDCDQIEKIQCRRARFVNGIIEEHPVLQKCWEIWNGNPWQNDTRKHAWHSMFQIVVRLWVALSGEE